MTRPVSQSDMLPFERCPALWHATRIRKLDDGTRFSRIGTACHVACEAVTRGVLGADGRELYLVARDAVTAHAESVNLPPDEMHEALDVMDAATAKDSAISFFVPQGWRVAVEQELALSAAFLPMGENAATALGDPIAYRGRLDRLQWNEATGELEVWDWKTSHDYMSSEELLLDVQARFYAMLALAWFPAAVKVVFKRVMLRLGYTAETTFIRGDRWESRIKDRARRLLNGVGTIMAAFDEHGHGRAPGFKLGETAGDWCRRCPVRGRCETYASAIERGSELYGGFPRLDRALVLLALKAAVAELDEQLRADVAANGPIALGDGRALGLHAKRMTVLKQSKEATLGELRQLGMRDDQERECFAPADRAWPACVRAAMAKIEPSPRLAQARLEALLANGTAFEFTTKEVENA